MIRTGLKTQIENFKDCNGLWVRSITIEGVQRYTKSDQVWRDIKKRCEPGGKFQEREPAYVGCTMSENFKDFQFFAEWHMRQVGFGFEGYELDKDLLFPGNKVYSEDACVLLPRSLNLFLTNRKALRGIYPQGVSFKRESGKFQAQISLVTGKKHLGYYQTPEEAFAAYKSAKEAEAKRWVTRLKDGEFLVDPRVIDRLKNWRIEDYV